jgi:hypothetical protein
MLGQKSKSVRDEVLKLIAQKAIVDKDYYIANECSLELIISGGKSALKLVLELGMDEDNPNLNHRLKFLSFALIHCDGIFSLADFGYWRNFNYRASF